MTVAVSADLPAAPLDAPQRYELVDALRGFALCGVLLANLSSFSLSDYLDAKAQAALPSAAFDAAVADVLGLVLHHKAVTVFSILFGFGFAMQLERAQARGEGPALFARRMAVLLAIGLVHTLFWWGDILSIYALAGFALLLFRRCPDRALPWMGFALALPATAACLLWLLAVRGAAQPQAFASALHALSSPSLAAAFAGNAVLQGWYQPIGGLMLVCFSLGRFLLGYWAGRHRLLQVPEAHRSLLRRILAWTLALGVPATLLRFWKVPVQHAVPASTEGIGQFVWTVVSLSGPLLIGIAVAALFVLAYACPGWRARLRRFAPVGRMALSNYLAQTVVCTTLFYGFGAGIGPRFGAAAWLLTWAVLFGAQMGFSAWWLQRFRFGPMEWVWRSLTYGRRQPMRIAADARAG